MLQAGLTAVAAAAFARWLLCCQLGAKHSLTLLLLLWCH
jgi:hypothetical protein